MHPVWIVALLGAAGPSQAALQILRQHECAKCHQVEGVRAPPKEASCAGCHIDIATSEGDRARTARGQENYGGSWPRFVERTGEHYCHIPTLSSMGRFQASWLRTFLLAPYDLRPNLGESMIRHALTDTEIEVLIRGWGTHDDVAHSLPPPERVAAGAKLFDQKGCAACHLFGNAKFPSAGEALASFTPRSPLRALAPDLRHARDRLSHSVLEQWVRDPKSVKPDTTMPPMAVTAEEASLLADYIYFGEPGAPAEPKPRRPPPYDPKAPVPAYEEVDAKVFSVVCLHCHEDTHADMGLMGDGGPGNTGGLGFRGVGLSFESYSALSRGVKGAAGKRLSVFRPGESGEPVLLERARLRYVENDRDFVLPGHDPLERPIGKRSAQSRGMPLGLPALTDEQFSVLERWIRGGHPGPVAVARTR